jgi:hypothetical protein
MLCVESQLTSNKQRPYLQRHTGIAVNEQSSATQEYKQCTTYAKVTSCYKPKKQTSKKQVAQTTKQKRTHKTNKALGVSLDVPEGKSIPATLHMNVSVNVMNVCF